MDLAGFVSECLQVVSRAESQKGIPTDQVVELCKYRMQSTLLFGIAQGSLRFLARLYLPCDRKQAAQGISTEQ